MLRCPSTGGIQRTTETFNAATPIQICATPAALSDTSIGMAFLYQSCANKHKRPRCSYGASTLQSSLDAQLNLLSRSAGLRLACGA
eukprot:187831-Rhodomonas_salina.1